jgi:hypothetical protein
MPGRHVSASSGLCRPASLEALLFIDRGAVPSVLEEETCL